jgi:predicted nucleic acid-binding protein
VIVDTNGLSAWWLDEPSFIRHIEKADRLCVPVPALAEFRFGILKSRFREKMTTWLDDALVHRARNNYANIAGVLSLRHGANRWTSSLATRTRTAPQIAATASNP